jgi:pilus assembly protein Flp/PilA
MEDHMLRNLLDIAVGQIVALKGNNKGVTAIEYGLIAGSIAVAIITAVISIGGSVADKFQAVADALAPTPAP